MTTDQTIDLSTGENPELDMFLKTAGLLYAGTSKLDALRTAVDSCLADISGLLCNRGLNAPTIGFVGDKNAGKSFLMSRLLITDEEVRKMIPDGRHSDDRTEELIWVGSSLPAQLDRSAERAVRIDPRSQTRFDCDIVLVDIPGFSDSHGEAARRARELALRSCQIKVLVCGAKQIEAERISQYARKIGGPVILPVMNEYPGAPDSAEAVNLAKEYMQLICNSLKEVREGLPSPLVLPVLVISDLYHAPPFETLDQAASRLVASLKEALSELQARPELIRDAAEIRRERFLEESRGFVRGDYGKVKELLVRVEQDTASMPTKLVPLLLGSNRVASTGIRLWLRTESLNRTASYFFPLRTFMGVLVLTSRAWDRLVLALCGSVPSLFSAALNIAKNVGLLRQSRNNSDEELERNVLRLVDERLGPDLEALRNQLDRLSASEQLGRRVKLKATLSGLADLQDMANAAFETTINSQAVSRGLINVTGWLSVIWCAVLLFGPLNGVYSHFLVTLWESVQAGSAITWQDFSVPPFSVIVGWFILACIPVFIIALALQAYAAGEKRVACCQKLLNDKITESVGDLSRSGILNIQINDPKVDAAREFFRILFRDLT
jgi:hypothetical protein